MQLQLRVKLPYKLYTEGSQMSIAEQIKQKREELNMTQEELAERLEVSR